MRTAPDGARHALALSDNEDVLTDLPADSELPGLSADRSRPAETAAWSPRAWIPSTAQRTHRHSDRIVRPEAARDPAVAPPTRSTRDRSPLALITQPTR